jgi:hypothetical protein
MTLSKSAWHLVALLEGYCWLRIALTQRRTRPAMKVLLTINPGCA